MIILALIFFVFGYLVKYQKMYWLIAGYNTMSKEEQNKIDVKRIATVFRNAMFGMAFILLIGWAIHQYIFPDNLLIEWYVMFGAILIGIPYLIIASNSINTN